jgi:hypothetical protein
MRRFVTAAVAALAASTLATAASAAVTITTFNLNVSDAFSNISAGIGTVKVTDNGIDLHIAIILDQGWEFRAIPDGSHQDVVFDVQDSHHNQLNGLSVTGLSNGFTQVAGNSFDSQPFKNFNYAIKCVICTKGWTGPDISHPNNPTSVSYNLVGVSESQLASVPYTPKNAPHGTAPTPVYFAVDLQRFGPGGSTGTVGATYWNQISYAPEPETWALMILGFGCIGADLRRRRRTALTA